MYQNEHDDFFASIRQERPINNGNYMAKSTMMAIMGRMAAYTGQEITWEQAMNSKQDLRPGKIRMGRPAHPAGCHARHHSLRLRGFLGIPPRPGADSRESLSINIIGLEPSSPSANNLYKELRVALFPLVVRQGFQRRTIRSRAFCAGPDF